MSRFWGLAGGDGHLLEPAGAGEWGGVRGPSGAQRGRRRPRPGARPGSWSPSALSTSALSTSGLSPSALSPVPRQKPDGVGSRPGSEELSPRGACFPQAAKSRHWGSILGGIHSWKVPVVRPDRRRTGSSPQAANLRPVLRRHHVPRLDLRCPARGLGRHRCVGDRSVHDGSRCAGARCVGTLCEGSHWLMGRRPWCHVVGVGWCPIPPEGLLQSLGGTRQLPIGRHPARRPVGQRWCRWLVRCRS